MTGSLRIIVAMCCVVASAAILVHHSVPSMDMSGPSSAETCVAVAAHAVEVAAAPTMLFFAFAGAVLLHGFSFGIAVRPTRFMRARAGPTELRIPLRC